MHTNKKLTPYLLILPVLIYYTLFWLRPVLSAVCGSFVGTDNQFTFDNYLAIFDDPVFVKAIGNTFFIVVFLQCLYKVLSLVFPWLPFSNNHVP